MVLPLAQDRCVRIPTKPAGDSDLKLAVIPGSSALLVQLWPGRGPLGSLDEASFKEVEFRATIHLTLHQFEPVDVPLDWAGAPGLGQSGLHGSPVTVQASRERRERTIPRRSHPGRQGSFGPVRRALARQRGERRGNLTSLDLSPGRSISAISTLGDHPSLGCMSATSRGGETGSIVSA